jgi:hypothetical protein
MSEKLVDLIREEDYALRAFQISKNALYTTLYKELVKFISNIYRFIEPSHIDGKVVVFFKISDVIHFTEDGVEFYDETILNHGFNSIVFQLFKEEEKLPLVYHNLSDELIATLAGEAETIVYTYQNGQEMLYVNGEEIKIINKYSCPSIFALQYHFLNEALLRYKNERVRKVSCEHFKNCWGEPNYLYWVNKPEDSIQLSVSEYLKNSLPGTDVVREYNMNASKPVDVRVYWRRGNRAALIEVKLMGRALKPTGDINSYEYDNTRANDGMTQVKEYMDLVESDSPGVINKGYLVVLDGRRNGINPKVATVSVANGMFYAAQDLVIDADKQFYNTHKNIEKPIRMFVEPICN